MLAVASVKETQVRSRQDLRVSELEVLLSFFFLGGGGGSLNSYYVEQSVFCTRLKYLGRDIEPPFAAYRPSTSHRVQRTYILGFLY